VIGAINVKAVSVERVRVTVGVVIRERFPSWEWGEDRRVTAILADPHVIAPITIVDSQTLVDKHDATIRRLKTPDKVDLDQMIALKNFAEAESLASHDVLAHEGFHVTFVNYLIVGVLVPISWPRATSHWDAR
jgi:hypothetical protein